MPDKQPPIIVDRRAAQPPPSQQPMGAEAGMKVALTVLALAALPISAWLYITTYVEDQVERGVARQGQMTTVLIERQEQDIHSLQVYVSQLCAQARATDREFSCAASPFSGRE